MWACHEKIAGLSNVSKEGFVNRRAPLEAYFCSRPGNVTSSTIQLTNFVGYS